MKSFLMVIDRLSEIPFADLLEKITMGIVDSQLALDVNGITTENYLSDIKLPAKSVVIAIVETVDQHGNITNIEPIVNEQPLSLAEFGLSPVFLQISEATVFLEFVTYLRKTESKLDPKQLFFRRIGIDQDVSQIDFNGANRTEPYIRLFNQSRNISSYSGKEKLTPSFRLTVSSATSVAVSSKVQGEWGVWRITATVRPKSPA